MEPSYLKQLEEVLQQVYAARDGALAAEKECWDIVRSSRKRMLKKTNYMKIKFRLAKRLRYLADLIDRKGAPKALGLSFTYEKDLGIKFRSDRRGCRIWYYGDEDYEKAHSEADTPA